MALNNTTEVTFSGLKKQDGKYYTLDGRVELTTHKYSKHISSIDELTKEEKDMFLAMYETMKTTIGSLNQIISVVNTLGVF